MEDTSNTTYDLFPDIWERLENLTIRKG